MLCWIPNPSFEARARGYYFTPHEKSQNFFYLGVRKYLTKPINSLLSQCSFV